MRVCGVICEYNPFHNGHLHHLRSLREKIECEYIVCVMSGFFTQRGEAALVGKWLRAEMALCAGADAVFELPTLFAVRDAERFARGGVALLNALGVVTHLGFGSESGQQEALTACMESEPDVLALKRALSQGKTLARAKSEATTVTASSPNDALAVEYLRALRTLEAKMEPVVIPRAGSGYHDQTLTALPSATAVRAAARRGESLADAVPEETRVRLDRAFGQGAYHEADSMDQMLLCSLRAMPSDTLAQTADIGEGLENRLSRASQAAASREELLALVKCKRYTRARLSRVATQAMLGITKELAYENPLPAYARVLGFRESARPLMAAIAKQSTIPIVTRAAPFRREGGPAFRLDLRAADLWALGCKAQKERAGGRDLVEPIRIF